MTQPGDPPAGPAPSTLRDGVDPYEHLAERPSAADRCPHCNGVGRVVPDDELRFVCALCGGPRFGALAPGLTPPEPAERALRDAEKARRARAGWRAATISASVGLSLMVLVGAVLAMFGAVTAALVLALVFVLPLAIAVGLSSSRARGAAAQIPRALDAAWGSLAVGAVRAGNASPGALARALGVGEAHAEQLHDVVAVDAELGTDVAPPRVRIGADPDMEPAPLSSLAPDPRFEALEARARAAEAEATAAGEAEGDARDTLARARTIVASPGDDGSPR